MKSRIKIPENITSTEDKRRFLLLRGECLTSSDLFEGFKHLKNKCEVTFVRMQDGCTIPWGVGPHQKAK